jgi:hypothetical protein
MTFGPEWRPHPRRDGFYVDDGRPGWMRDRAGNLYADPDGPTCWFRVDGRVIHLQAPHEPAAAERQGKLLDARERFRARLLARRQEGASDA